MDVTIKYYVDESEIVRYVAAKLDIPHSDADDMYSELGGYRGHDVNFSTTHPDADAFSVVVQTMMRKKGIDSLAARYDD